MKASRHLFDLVQSLSTAEKKHFRKGLSLNKRGGRHQYLELFDALAGQATFDEQALKEQFKGTSFAKSLAFPKSHLYKLLLKSLGSYHAERSSSSRFRAILDQIDLLMERGLPQQALRLLRRSLKQAVALQQAEQVLQLLRRQRRLTLQIQPAEFARQITALSKAETHWEKAFAHEQEAVRLHDEVYATFQAVRRKTRAKAPNHIHGIRDRLLELLALPELTFPTQVASLRGLAHFHHMQENFAAVHDAYQAEVKAWESSTLQIEIHPRRYVRAMALWLSSKALIGDFSQLLSQIKALRKRQGLDLRSQAEVFQTTWNLELFYYLNSEQTQLAIPLIPQLASGLKTHAAYLLPSAKLGFYHNLSLVLWLENQPAKALHWVHKILHFPAGEIRKDIRNFAPVLEMLLHHELGNLRILESCFRAQAYRKRTKNQDHPLADLLTRLLQELNQAHPPQPSFQRFLEGLDHLQTQANVSKLGFEVLKKWANKHFD